MSRSLLDAGLPPAVVARWADTINGDKAVQARAQQQKPFSRAYKAWSESGSGKAGVKSGGGGGAEDEDEPDGKATAGGWSNSAAHQATSMFGDTLQVAMTKAKFKSAAKANSVTAALHGKDADAQLVAALQKLYVDQVRQPPDFFLFGGVDMLCSVGLVLWLLLHFVSMIQHCSRVHCQVVRDSVPRLRTDTDRMAATSQEGRFPNIVTLLRS